MTDGGVKGDGERERAAEPPNQIKFSTAPVKTQEGGAVIVFSTLNYHYSFLLIM